MRACGHRCYSIYLIHLPICTVGTEALIQLGCRGFWTRALVVAPLVALAGVGAGWLFCPRRVAVLHPAPVEAAERHRLGHRSRASLATDAGPAGAKARPLVAV